MQPPPFGERRGHPAYTPEQRADGSPEHLFIFLPGEAGADAISGKPKMDPVRNGPGVPFRKLSGSLLHLSLMLFFFFNAEPACANLVFKNCGGNATRGMESGVFMSGTAGSYHAHCRIPDAPDPGSGTVRKRGRDPCE